LEYCTYTNKIQIFKVCFFCIYKGKKGYKKIQEGCMMAEKNHEQQKKNMVQQQKNHEMSMRSQERTPDEQNRLKDQENLRK